MAGLARLLLSSCLAATNLLKSPVEQRLLYCAPLLRSMTLMVWKMI